MNTHDHALKRFESTQLVAAAVFQFEPAYLFGQPSAPFFYPAGRGARLFGQRCKYLAVRLNFNQDSAANRPSGSPL